MQVMYQQKDCVDRGFAGPAGLAEKRQSRKCRPVKQIGNAGHHYFAPKYSLMYSWKE